MGIELDSIADLVAAGVQGPQGAKDLALHTGTILTWSRDTGANTVLVNGSILTNLKALQGGIPTPFATNDVVLLVRKQTQYFIMGRIASPGAGAGSGVKSEEFAWADTFNTAGAWIANPNVAHEDPSFSVYVGPLGRCLVMWQVIVKITLSNIAGGNPNPAIEASIGYEKSGATVEAAGSFTGQIVYARGAYTGLPTGQSMEMQHILTGNYQDRLLTPGLTTFTLKYRTLGGAAEFKDPCLIVIPF